MERYDITIQMYSADASGPQYVWEKVPAEEGELVLYTDAQATIAALQARVNGLEKDSELLRQSRDDFRVKYESVKNDAITLQSQLTQRTAELEAARTALNALRDGYDDLESRHSDAQAELERVRDQFADLRTMVAALPKVEGAVVVSNGYVKDSTRCHALFGADEDAASYAALLQHRQGMEG